MCPSGNVLAMDDMFLSFIYRSIHHINFINASTSVCLLVCYIFKKNISQKCITSTIFKLSKTSFWWQKLFIVLSTIVWLQSKLKIYSDDGLDLYVCLILLFHPCIDGWIWWKIHLSFFSFFQTNDQVKNFSFHLRHLTMECFFWSMIM